MFLRNKELRRGLFFLTAVSLCLSVFAFIVDVCAGWMVMIACLMVNTVYLLTERYRYCRLQTMIMELDRLLTTGTGLQITQYEEGELSILASQIEKITLRLQETALAQQKE